MVLYMYDAPPSQKGSYSWKIARQSKQNKEESGSSIDSGERPSSAIEIISDYDSEDDSKEDFGSISTVTHTNGWNHLTEMTSFHSQFSFGIC